MKMRYNRERDFQLHHKPSVGWPMHPDALGSSQRFPINSLAGSGSEGDIRGARDTKAKEGKEEERGKMEKEVAKKAGDGKAQGSTPALIFPTSSPG